MIRKIKSKKTLNCYKIKLERVRRSSTDLIGSVPECSNNKESEGPEDQHLEEETSINRYERLE